MFVINHKKIFFALSAIFVGLAIFSICFFGLNFGIDFKGGAILEISYPMTSLDVEKPDIKELKTELQQLGLGSFTIQETSATKSGELGGFILRTKDLTEKERQSVIAVLSQNGQYQIEEKRYNSIGPVIGKELKDKALWAILIVVVAIILFITFAFRKVSKTASNAIGKVSSWKYGFAAIIALSHDVIIPTGIYAYLGSVFVEYQINTIFIMAILAILGFSVNDTIVVFDRVRENLALAKKETFDEAAGKSLRQTVARSINTSLTTLAVLLALYFFGGEATKQFALILSMGVVVGTYSSIFLATPLLTLFQKRK
ncbi:MAG: protein translocase subunit SecF [Candidatus Pacebacteria bacterium]|nr:protein translocase subunit SecF [Candidatus Paceibacterota bacterium]